MFCIFSCRNVSELCVITNNMLRSETASSHRFFGIHLLGQTHTHAWWVPHRLQSVCKIFMCYNSFTFVHRLQLFPLEWLHVETHWTHYVMPTGDNFGRKCHNLDECSLCTFTARPLVETMFRRGMTTCFAYGQTGSGKTFVNYFDQTIEDIDLDVL